MLNILKTPYKENLYDNYNNNIIYDSLILSNTQILINNNCPMSIAI